MMPDEIDLSATRNRFERLVSEPVRKGLVSPKTRTVSEKLAETLAELFNSEPNEKKEFRLIESMVQLSTELTRRTSTPMEVLLKTFTLAIEEDYQGYPKYCERGLFTSFGMELARSAVSSGAAICLAANSGHYTAVSVHHFSIDSDEPNYDFMPNDIWGAWETDKYYVELYGADNLHFVLYETILDDPELAAKLNFTPSLGVQKDGLTKPTKQGRFARLDEPYVKRGLEMIKNGEVSNVHAAARALAEEMWKKRNESKDRFGPGASEDAIIARLGRQLRKAL